jgi:hypothetical protein
MRTYKEHSIISGTDLPSGQKLTLSLLAIITLEIVPFRVYIPFPAFLPFFKCTLGFVFFEDVQHRYRFRLDHHNCIKMVAFQFYRQSEKQKKKKYGGVKNESVRRRTVVMQQPVLLSPEFGAKSSHIFTQLP